jgi:hypothetical protein
MQDQHEECGQCGRVARAAWLPRHHLRAGRADLGEFSATCGPRRQRTAVAGLLRSNVIDARRAEARSCRRQEPPVQEGERRGDQARAVSVELSPIGVSVTHTPTGKFSE